METLRVTDTYVGSCGSIYNPSIHSSSKYEKPQSPITKQKLITAFQKAEFERIRNNRTLEMIKSWFSKCPEISENDNIIGKIKNMFLGLIKDLFSDNKRDQREMFVLSMLYMDRVYKVHQEIFINKCTISTLWILAIVLAYKMLEDKAGVSYSTIQAITGLQDINHKTEHKFLSCYIEYNLYVSNEDYFVFYTKHSDFVKYKPKI